MSAATLLPYALAALVPVMIGPLPAEAGRTLTMHLCNGGTITIPLDEGTPAQDGPCHPKGCHAGTCRDDKSAKLISRKDAA
jgi:hypothetical protein